MQERTAQTRQRIDGVRIELALLPILSVVRRFVLPAHSEIEGQFVCDLPVVLKIGSCIPPTRKPRGKSAREGRAGHSPQQKRRKRVARVRFERELCATELISTR